MRILSGVQSNGKLHIGNYFGAIKQFVAHQDEGEALYFIANLHSLTTLRNGDEARRLTFETAVTFLSLGLDPNKACLFKQSDIPEVTELYWILSTIVPVSHLNRAHSYKDKVAKGISPDFGLYAYPLLMAADILLYGTDIVPVGRDQLQHVEFARDWAVKFNHSYDSSYDPAKDKERPSILKLPEARITASGAIVPGIDGQKMSKSYGNTIDIFSDDASIKKRIMSIVTDSTPVEAPKPPEHHLLRLLEAMADPTDFSSLSDSWARGGVGYGSYKQKLLDLWHSTFDGPRELHAKYTAEPGYVDDVLAAGAKRARETASPTISRVRHAVGLF